MQKQKQIQLHVVSTLKFHKWYWCKLSPLIIAPWRNTHMQQFLNAKMVSTIISFGHVTIPTLRSVIHHLDKSDKSTLLYICCFCKKILWIYTKENLQKPSNFLKGYEREYFHLFHQPKLLIWKTTDSGEDTKIKTLPYYCC